jgi:hypothetical protein
LKENAKRYAINFMKSWFLILGLLIIFSFRHSFAQQKLTEDEILNEYRKTRTTSSIDSIFRWDIHAKTRVMLDNLIKSGVDTLVVYSVRFPGLSFIGELDSCESRDPVNSHFFWKSGGKYLYSGTDRKCESEMNDIDGNVVKFAVDNYSNIEGEFFMGAISGGERRGKHVVLEETFINHEPKYSILVVVGDQYNYLTFTENALTDDTSLFLGYNKGLTSFRLFELIKAQVGGD